MNILITGGAGFIGSNFIHYWLDKHPQDKIVNLDALTYAGNLENLKDIKQNPNYEFIKGNICDPHIVDKAMSNCDCIIHFAAESHVDRSIQNSDEFVKTNVVGTQVLLEAARKKNTRFHHISTDEVYGSLKLGSEDKFSEKTPYNPRNPYSASKAGSDHLVRSYFHTYQLPITISNTSNNYGPYQFPEKFFPLAITNLIEDKPIPVYGSGNQIRDWLHVLDHCQAIDLIIQKGKIGETYCIGGLTEDIPNLQLAKKIIKRMGKSESLINFVKDRPGHDARYTINWTKAKKELGYQPQYSLETYLQTTIDWYQQNQSWWQNVKSGEYKEYYKQQYES